MGNAAEDYGDDTNHFTTSPQQAQSIRLQPPFIFSFKQIPEYPSVFLCIRNYCMNLRVIHLHDGVFLRMSDMNTSSISGWDNSMLASIPFLAK